jgi:O-antigen/teichoic acid export membrane protein
MTTPRDSGGLSLLAGLARFARVSTGLRASAILLTGVVANIVGAYAFNLICIRWLGVRDYAEVAALTAITTILLLPLLGVQAALAREVAAFAAAGDAARNAALFRLTVRRMLILTCAGFTLFVVLSPLIERVLGIDDRLSVIAAGAAVASGVALPVLQGFLQGIDRFRRISVALVVYALGRPALTVPLVLAGLGVAGALTAGAIASVVAAGIAVAGLVELARSPGRDDVTIELRGFVPVIVGLLGFTILVNLDVVAAKAFLPDDEAGTYAAASLVGKLAALLPAGAIAPVLLPRATGRIERGEDPRPIVAISLAATALFGLALTLVLLPVPESLVEWAFGEQFAGARDLLAPCAAAMTLCGLINVQLTFAFALRDRQLVTLVCVGVAIQVALLSVLHESPYQILVATGLAALAVLALHEVRSPTAFRGLRASRSGYFPLK